MSALSVVRDVLRRSPAVRSAVRGNIWPIELPQESTGAALVVTLVSERDERHLLGSNRYPVASVLVDAYGDSYDAADDLGDTVKDALIDYRGTVAGTRIDDIGPGDIDHFDHGEDGTAWRRRLGFYMRYRVLEPVGP